MKIVKLRSLMLYIIIFAFLQGLAYLYMSLSRSHRHGRFLRLIGIWQKTPLQEENNGYPWACFGGKR